MLPGMIPIINPPLTGMAAIVARFQGTGNFSLWDFRPGEDTIFSDTGLTTPITSSGTGIAGVRDLGNYGHNLTQSTSGNRPTSGAAGQPASFDGTNDTLSRSGVHQVGTAIAVWRVNNNNSFGVLTNTADQGTNVDMAIQGGSGVHDTTQAAGAGLANSSHYWRNQSLSVFYSQNTLAVTSVDGTSFPATMQFPTGVLVGQDRAIGVRFLNGTIGAIFTHANILSADDRNFVEDTFAELFGITF